MKKIIIIASIITIVISCSKTTGSGGGGNSSGGGSLDCASVPKSFMTDVNPIIQGVCNSAGCHNAGSTNGPGPLTNYTQVFNSRVAIRVAISSGAMPKGTTS